MNKIITIAWNMIRRSIGSVKGVMIFILLPSVVVAAIISLTGGVAEGPATVLYANADTGAAGKHLLAELEKTGDYKFEPSTDEASLKEAVIGQEGAAGVWIPAGYSAALLAGRQPQLKIYELRVSESSIVLKMKINAVAGNMTSAANTVAVFSSGAADQQAQFAAVLEQAEQHNVGSTRTDYDLYPRETLGVITGLTLMFLMALVTSSVSLIMDDRRGRTMMRMFSAPVTSYEIALGNFLGSFLVGIIQIIVVLTLGKWVLRYDYGMPMVLYFLVLAAFMLVSMGIASTVAGLIRNPRNAGMLNSLILTPTCMLGGCFWPISIMPDYMQKLANFTPQKWAIQAVDIAATGGGWNELWLPFAILGLMAAVLLVIGSAILRPSEAGISS
ncbi:ABC transporter permease [Paenibacillus sp. MMS20-IR301]|uniref:ABC transporter permease n=1 Tax=Paenibacillus sp. MMS20-IR301 TaxID=2895946 RepID=UPI0028E273BA|nr:ABC transporter permease [Paenibacillus sp. MMS20-IR301]WNS42708.1 ABC transporter permease [Paenibacillus sp. MMS20-IR301]